MNRAKDAVDEDRIYYERGAGARKLGVGNSVFF